MLNSSTHKGFILWILGPTSSGKTTIAELLLKKIRSFNKTGIHFDGDEVRDFFGPDYGFAASDRLRVVKTLVHLANKTLESGVNAVIVSALTANNDAREYVFQHTKNLIIVDIQCSIAICTERDPKGLYEKAASGKIKTLIGFNTDYHSPEIIHKTINSEVQLPEESVDSLIDFLKINNYL